MLEVAMLRHYTAYTSDILITPVPVDMLAWRVEISAHALELQRPGES